MGSEPDGLKDRGQGGDEVFQPGPQIGLASAEVVVVVGMDGQSSIIAGQVAGVVLLQGEEAVQAVAPFVQDEGGQQASCPAVAVVVGVDGDKLIVDQAGYEGSGQTGPSASAAQATREAMRAGTSFASGGR